MTEFTPTAAGPSGPRASFLQRLGAAIVDWVILVVVGIVIGLIFGRASGVVGLIVGIAYFTYFEGGETGQTIGKRAIGIRVADFRGGTGGPIGYPRAFVRYIGRYVSAFVCLLGYLWMLWDKEKQCWHDKFAGSVVVPADRA